MITPLKFLDKLFCQKHLHQKTYWDWKLLVTFVFLKIRKCLQELRYVVCYNEIVKRLLSGHNVTLSDFSKMILIYSNYNFKRSNYASAVW